MKYLKTEGKRIRIVSQKENPNKLDVYLGDEKISGVYKVEYNAEAASAAKAVIHVIKPIIDVNLDGSNTIVKELEKGDTYDS